MPFAGGSSPAHAPLIKVRWSSSYDRAPVKAKPPGRASLIAILRLDHGSTKTATRPGRQLERIESQP